MDTESTLERMRDALQDIPAAKKDELRAIVRRLAIESAEALERIEQALQS